MEIYMVPFNRYRMASPSISAVRLGKAGYTHTELIMVPSCAGSRGPVIVASPRCPDIVAISKVLKIPYGICGELSQTK
jgi:hypothetical protein